MSEEKVVEKEIMKENEEAADALAAEEQEAATGPGDGIKEAAEKGEEAEGKAPKKKNRDKKQDKLKEKVEELEDRVKRQMAEFENFRKRTDKEKTQMFETGAKSVVEKILPVVDNFERGLQTLTEGEENTPFSEGMHMVYKQLMQELEGIGVKPIEALGQEFNPDFHNAVMQVESETYDSGIIAQELLKGYMYNDSVVRHSMVAVVQ